MLLAISPAAALGLSTLTRAGWVSSPLTVCGDSRPAAAPRWSTVVRMQEDSSEGRGGFDQKMFDYYANPETFKDTTLTVMELPNPVLREVGKPVTDFDDKLAKLWPVMVRVERVLNAGGGRMVETRRVDCVLHLVDEQSWFKGDGQGGGGGGGGG